MAQTTFWSICLCRNISEKLNAALSGLKGVICVADDIVVHGKDVDEHDNNMNKFLDVCNKVGIRLNKEKTDLRAETITFMGHKISKNGMQVDPN